MLFVLPQTDAETEFIKKAKREMGKDESSFAVEVNLQQKPYMWSDKYRPRKPRFFNRVHTVSTKLLFSFRIVFTMTDYETLRSFELYDLL